MNTARNFDRLLAKAEGWSLILILFVMMCVAFLQVVLRNCFHTALPWGDGLTRALVLWAGFIGASLAVREGRYLSMDLLTRWLNERWQRRTRLVVYLYSSGVCLLLGLAGTTFVTSEHSARTMTSLGLPNWVVAGIIPLTFFCICFRFALKAVDLMLGGEPEKHAWEQ